MQNQKPLQLDTKTVATNSSNMQDTPRSGNKFAMVAPEKSSVSPLQPSQYQRKQKTKDFYF
jgi:hypothetical protein